MSELSVVERRILANQYRILRAVAPDEARYYQYDELITILEQGFEGQYGRILGSIEENRLSPEDCQLVADVLTMSSWLRDHAANLRFDLDDFRQVGFDHNTEHEYLQYAQFLYEQNPGGHPGIEGVVNNHRSGNVEHYRKMTREWRASDHPANLSEDDVARILDAS